MATKKLSKFEYAGEEVPGSAGFKGLHRQAAFETPAGYAFVVVSSAVEEKSQADLTALVIDRIRYYMNTETEDSISSLSGNALVYTSGYLKQQSEKDPAKEAKKISCLCVLLHEETIHYAAAGDVCLWLFTDRKLIPVYQPPSQAAIDAGADRNYMGNQSLIKPVTGTPEGVAPLDHDKLLIGSASLCKCLTEKQARKILQDSMPLKSKTLRLLQHACQETPPEAAALMILSFYELQNQERIVVPLEQPEVHKQGISKDKPKTNTAKKTAVKKPVVSAGLYYWLKLGLRILALLFVGYMIYDLFIFDPHPPIQIPAAITVVEEDVAVDLPEDTLSFPEQEPPAMPDDLTYTVRAGDTWSSIYRRYRVCSWFIINHPPNRGRLGREGSLIAGQSLRIPVKYSGSPDLNPHYYHEFTLDKVGSNCQNANRAFIESFEATYQNR